jgi:radical SAM-linked protein
VFKARMKFAKEGRAKYISHLDLMHAMQRSMARCRMPLWFTEGFNQHAYVSVALPLSTGYSGECEFLDFNLLTEKVPDDAVKNLNAVFPEGLRAIEIYPLSDGGMKIADIAWSKYRITWGFDGTVPENFVSDVQTLFAQDCIEILKRSKRGEKLVNMREFMYGQPNLTDFGNFVICEVTTGAGNNNMSPEYLTKAIAQYLPQYSILDEAYHRVCVYNGQGVPFR